MVTTANTMTAKSTLPRTISRLGKKNGFINIIHYEIEHLDMVSKVKIPYNLLRFAPFFPHLWSDSFFQNKCYVTFPDNGSPALRVTSGSVVELTVREKIIHLTTSNDT